MTPLLAANLRDQITTLRLTTPAEAAAGAGERPAARIGAGLEFAGLRPFRTGDDPRALDARATARAGRPTLREYAADQRLAVTLICDDSVSMATMTGRPARALHTAALVGALTLAGGDRLDVHFGGTTARFAGAHNTAAMLSWLADTKPRHRPFSQTLRSAAAALSGPGLLVVISDWQDPAARAQLQPLVQTRPLIALRLPAPSEDAPPLGPATLIDAETGAQITLDITPAMRDAYMAAATAETRALQSLARASGGALVNITPATDILRELHQNGLISD
ncbi:protein of unknown function DUF58 (plasmid) [Ketogulonicigenium robustum]|uniref:DUF58 domain-containing protein n=1 Tax=Ketogulonicigenium robustum TaxID=92947 RepID=A0A1W6P310_9RHOB|nr:DUF58 domain-containing protein [Ketogulonicigenium robustum]ARO15834.1 protein of unknown function DUF58 [Ketogulonicigenium robustum]